MVEATATKIAQNVPFLSVVAVRANEIDTLPEWGGGGFRKINQAKKWKLKQTAPQVIVFNDDDDDCVEIERSGL